MEKLFTCIDDMGGLPNSNMTQTPTSTLFSILILLSFELSRIVMHGTPIIPINIMVMMIFIFIACILQNHHHANLSHDIGGKKKALDDISYLNNGFILYMEQKI